VRKGMALDPARILEGGKKTARKKHGSGESIRHAEEGEAQDKSRSSFFKICHVRKGENKESGTSRRLYAPLCG